HPGGRQQAEAEKARRDERGRGAPGPPGAAAGGEGGDQEARARPGGGPQTARGGLVIRRGRPAGLAAGLLAVLVSAVRPLDAQTVSVRARADRRSVEENGQVVLTVEVYGTSLGEVAPPDVSGISDFDIVGGPMTSNRFQWVNGQTSSTRSYTYFLRPRRIGTQKIPALGLLVNGHPYRTDPIEIEV